MDTGDDVCLGMGTTGRLPPEFDGEVLLLFFLSFVDILRIGGGRWETGGGLSFEIPRDVAPAV